VKAARSALERCLVLDPNQPDCHFIYGQVELVAGRWRILQHQSPEPEFRNAMKWLDRALEVTAPSPNIDAWISKVSVTRYWAEWKVASKQNAKEQIRLGLEAVSRALEINPHSPEMISARGVFLLLQARSELNATQRKNLAHQASVSLEEGLKQNANLTHYYGHYLSEAQSLDRM
jgi:hypothetical protein